jgi:hypothetical protein
MPANHAGITRLRLGSEIFVFFAVKPPRGPFSGIVPVSMLVKNNPLTIQYGEMAEWSKAHAC